MDRYYSSAISKESSDIYSIPNSTQHDARQRCPALIVLKEENNNNNRAISVTLHVWLYTERILITDYGIS